MMSTYTLCDFLLTSSYLSFLLFSQFSVYTWRPNPSSTSSVYLVPEFSQQKFSCEIKKGIATYTDAVDVSGKNAKNR